MANDFFFRAEAGEQTRLRQHDLQQRRAAQCVHGRSPLLRGAWPFTADSSFGALEGREAFGDASGPRGSCQPERREENKSVSHEKWMNVPLSED